MKSFKFIHAADLHLDSPFKGLTDIPQSIKQQLLKSTFQAFSRLIDQAIHHNVSFIVISGDLFDAEQRSLRAQLFLFEQFERLKAHHIHVYLIHGNHDPISEKQSSFQFGSHVHIFNSNEVTMQPAYHEDELVAYIYGISYGEKAVYNNLAKQYFKQDDDVFHLALYHGSVGSSQEHEPYAPCSVQDLVVHQYDYVALGHIHKPQVLYDDTLIVYSGNIQGRHRKENGERGCYLVEVNNQKSTKLTFLPLATIQWENIAVDCSHISDEQQLIFTLQREIHKECTKDGQCYMLTLELYGTTALHQILKSSEKQRDVLEALRSLFPIEDSWIYISKLKIETSMSYNKAALIAEEQFLQKLVEKYEQFKLRPTDEMLQIKELELLLQHHDLSRLLPQLHRKIVHSAIEDGLNEILDLFAQEKGREL